MTTLENLINNTRSTQVLINGKWVPGRSINHKYRSIFERFRDAWWVFTGKADCFIWPEGQ